MGVGVGWLLCDVLVVLLQDMDGVLELGFCLRGEIRSATSSLTSVPKPLKILVGSYDDIKGLFEDLKLKVHSPWAVQRRE